jgi:hypothetical protein
MRISILTVCVAALLCAPGAASAVLFSENFDVDPTANWMVNPSHATGSDADFFFDYSTVGIPPAPNSGGSTRGLRMRANRLGNGIFSGISVSPNGLNLTGDYTVTFDAWLSFQGSTANGILDGGSGTTQVTNFGILTAGNTAQWAGGVQDSLHFGATGDGGSSVDYRAYSPAAGVGYGDASGVFAAGNEAGVRNDTHAYYQGLGSKQAPAAQLALYPATQHGTTRPGAAGFAWREMVIDKVGDVVTWTMDGLLIATVDITGINFGGGNILFGQYDINAGSSTDLVSEDLLFGLIDNIVVIPEPATLALLVLGGLPLLGRRRR